MREIVDHWLLVAVRREQSDLDAQRFILDMERGSRRGLAWSKRATVTLGPFDEETLFSLGHVVEQAAGRFAPERWW